MKATEKSISSVAALLVLAVFSIGILGVLLGGARVYKGLTGQGQADYDRRTCLQYLSTKLSQSTSPESITLRQFGTGDALFLTESIDGREYVTRIYCHNGWLMELFSVNADGFAPEDGEKILPLDSLYVTQSAGLLTLRAICGEDTWTLHHSIRGYRHEK